MDTPMTPEGTISPDGAWRWQEGQWVPNLPTTAARTGEAAPPQAGDPPPAVAPAPRRPLASRRNVWLAVVSALVIAAGLFTVTRGSSTKPELRGRLTLMGGGGYTMQDPCHGLPSTQGDNTDLGGGTPVKVLNASGAIIASGQLSVGHLITETEGDQQYRYCRFAFDLPLDASSTQYQLVIADRNPYVVSDVSHVDLTLGGGRPPSGSGVAAPQDTQGLDAPSPESETSAPAALAPASASTSNKLTLRSGCPTGKTVATTRTSGLRLKIVKSSGYGFDFCITLPDGTTRHPIQDATSGPSGYGVSVETFSTGQYFKRDSLGHVFALIYPGQVSGVTVVIPEGNSIRVLGPFGRGGVVGGTDPVEINVTENDCVPNCAEGHQTTHTLRWDRGRGDYT